MKQPKILLYDLEVAPNVAYVWGKYEQNVLSYVKEWEILCFAYKWLGDDKVKFVKGKEKDIVTKLHKLQDQADVLIAHNGDEFDHKKSTAKFIEYGLLPPTPSATVDTKRVAKSYFKFNSNSLNDLGQTLGLGKKVSTGGFELWLGCMDGDKASWKLMEKYNKQDVILLEKVYKKLLPWIKNHPNLAILKYEDRSGCANCGGFKFKSNGYRATNKGRFQRLQCLDCGAWTQNSKKV